MKLNSQDEIRHDRRLVRGLLKPLLRIRMIPVFVIALVWQVDIIAVEYISVTKILQRTIRERALRPALHKGDPTMHSSFDQMIEAPCDIRSERYTSSWVNGVANQNARLSDSSSGVGTELWFLRR